MHPPRPATLWTGAAAALLELCACACNADESAVDGMKAEVAAQTVEHCMSCPRTAHDFSAPALDETLGAPLATNRGAVSTSVPVARAGRPSTPTPNPFANLHFRDQEPLVNRLLRLQAVPFVTLWDSREATVYVGVDRKGKAGLHLRQKRDDRGARATPILTAAQDERAAPRPPKSRRR